MTERTRPQRARVALADLTQRLATAREERDRRAAQYRALDAAEVSDAKQMRAWRKLRGARRVVQALEDRINARLSVLGNYCVGDTGEVPQ